MLRTLDIFSMIVIVPRPSLARGGTHYSDGGYRARGGNHRPNFGMIYPVFGYPLPPRSLLLLSRGRGPSATSNDRIPRARFD